MTDAARRAADFDQLLADYLADQLDDAGCAMLKERLTEDDAALDQYLHAATLEAMLAWRHGRASIDQTLRPRAGSASAWRATEDSRIKVTPTLLARSPVDGSGASPRSVWYLAALLLLAAALTYVFLPSTPHSELPTPHSATPASFAILSDLSNDATFADGSLPLGSDLTGPIQLTVGRAQLMFKSFAVVDLTGPCEFQMTGPNRGTLHHGQLEAYVPTEAHGFTVDLPGGSKIIDLGTRFAARVDGDDQCVVQVLEGRVQFVGADGVVRTMTAEQAIAVAGTRLLTLSPGDLRLPVLGRPDISPIVQSLVRDPALVVYYDFNQLNIAGDTLLNLVPTRPSIQGVIHGAKRVPGRSPADDALQFDGSDDSYVQLDPNIDYTDLTLMLWVNIRQLDNSSSGLIMSDFTDGTVMTHLQVDRHGNLSFQSAPTAKPFFDASHLNCWVQVAVVIDARAGIVDIYRDGQLFETHPARDAKPVHLGLIRIGNWNARDYRSQHSLHRGLDGRIDDVIIARRPMTAGEIKKLYDAGRTP
ncbi:MAG: hypothetical protein GC162_02450 [Planctomycetes bacterium]|nr:hypothetical protein [Planctomycetota bacterium]